MAAWLTEDGEDILLNDLTDYYEESFFVPSEHGVEWYNGTTRLSTTRRGWWDGAVEQPVILRGFWNGTSIDPIMQ